MELDRLENRVEEISVPENLRNLPIDFFYFSVRLENVLRRLNIEVLGDLSELSFNDIEQTRNCGSKTIDELRQFITSLKDENNVEMMGKEFRQRTEDHENGRVRKELIEKIERSFGSQSDDFVKTIEEKIFVPQTVKEIPLKCFTLSVRLENVLDQLDIKVLGDLETYTLREIRKAKNCGSKSFEEFQSFIIGFQKLAGSDEFSEEFIKEIPTPLDLNGLLKFINDFLVDLPGREREVLLSRFGGTNHEKVITLEEIGERFEVTRERIRQIESKNVKNLVSRLTSISSLALEKLKTDCIAAVCPLTGRFLIHLTGNEFSLFEYPPEFYLRLLRTLSPGIPIFIQTERLSQNSKNVKKIAKRIKELLDEQTEFLTQAEVFNRISFQSWSDNLAINDFFEAMQTDYFIIETGDAPDVFLLATNKNRLTMDEIARQVLEKSDVALKPEEIIQRAREMFGSEVEMPSINSFTNLPGYEPDFYLLDSRTIGLRQHFRLPEEYWKKVQDDFYELLKNEGRPVSTTETLTKRLFDWTEQTTASEATEILREDGRLKDLGRFLFALTEWEIEERVPVKDLVVRVLEETDEALTATEIGERIQKYRSVTTTAMPTILRSHTEIKIFDFGYYGLKSKGGYKEFFATNDKYLKRFVKKFSPVTFSDVCEKLEIGNNAELADKIWDTLQKIGKLRFSPPTRSMETVISFRS